MSQAYKEALSICKTIMRNGFDAYVINARLQEEILEASLRNGLSATFDIACEANFDDLIRLFPTLEHSFELGVVGVLEQSCVDLRFHRLDCADSAHPDKTFLWFTPSMQDRMESLGLVPKGLLSEQITPSQGDEYQGFHDFASGQVALIGLPDHTLKSDYLLGIRALRFAANFNLPVEPGTWMAIVRQTQDLLNYISAKDFVTEWKQVQPENMWKFVRMLFDSQILHGLIPELAALSCVQQTRNDNSEAEESVLEHTIQCVRHYPKDDLSYDWLGTVGALFHDVGKLYTADFYAGRWTFYQHHVVGALVTRKILRRLNMPAEESELICHLVKNHLKFTFTLTDRGLRRFSSLGEGQRIIAMCRADIEARDGNYTAYNHNMKYLERAQTPEQMVEPLLNGNEIMEFTHLKPGKEIGQIRDSLLKAQIAGEVKTVPEAVEFVIRAAKASGQA